MAVCEYVRCYYTCTEHRPTVLNYGRTGRYLDWNFKDIGAYTHTFRQGHSDRLKFARISYTVPFCRALVIAPQAQIPEAHHASTHESTADPSQIDCLTRACAFSAHPNLHPKKCCCAGAASSSPQQPTTVSPLHKTSPQQTRGLLQVAIVRGVPTFRRYALRPITASHGDTVCLMSDVGGDGRAKIQKGVHI